MKNSTDGRKDFERVFIAIQALARTTFNNMDVDNW